MQPDQMVLLALANLPEPVGSTRPVSDMAFAELLAGPVRLRGQALILAVDSPAMRIPLLQLGFGDVLGLWANIDELAVRAQRVRCRAAVLPRRHQLGTLILDLMRRDAMVAGRRIGLHPREFALLWCLAEAGGRGVSMDDLLREVWGQSFRPETNSLAVHVSRLRTKLRDVGQDGLIVTEPDGGYRINRRPTPALALPADTLPLDDYLRLRDEAANLKQDADHAARLQTERADRD